MKIKKIVSLCTVVLIAFGPLASAALAYVPCQDGCGGACCQNNFPQNGFAVKSALIDCCQKIGATACHPGTQKGFRHQPIICSGTQLKTLPQPFLISGQPVDLLGIFDKPIRLGRDPADCIVPTQTPIYLQNLTFLI